MKYIVQYGALRQCGVFTYTGMPLHYGHRVVVKTPRGREAGTVRCNLEQSEAAQKYAGKFAKELAEGTILRLMADSDEIALKKLQLQENEKLEQCRQTVQNMNIPMKPVFVEHTLGGEKVIIYYTAENRVDFRELLKILAVKFHSRIEMRQISSREELKLLHIVGDCGREVCCGCCLRETPGISIKMAKLQKVSLEPTKISGHCGRLKCCLRYEYDTYAITQAGTKNKEK